MGTPPDFEEDASEKIRIILQAIHDHRKIDVTYRDSGDTERQSIRIPLMIIIYEDELYVGCQRMDGNTYTLKFRRIKKVKLSKEMFAEDPKVVDKLRRQVTSGAAFMSGQEPKLQDVEIEFLGHARLYLEENPFNRSMQIGKQGRQVYRETEGRSKPDAFQLGGVFLGRGPRYQTRFPT